MEIPGGAVAGGVGAAKLWWEMAARETLGMDPAHGTQPRGLGDIPETPPSCPPMTPTHPRRLWCLPAMRHSGARWADLFPCKRALI